MARRPVRPVVVALAALVAAAAPAAAQEPEVFRSYNDVLALQPAQPLEQILTTMRSSICQSPRGFGALRGAAGQKRAIRATKKALDATKKGELKRLKRRLKTSRTAGLAAAGGVAKALAGPSLAAALTAVERAPRNAIALNNAGLLLAQTGHPNEAIALLDGAIRRPSPQPPMGIAIRAIAESNKAYALIVLRRYQAAESLARAALRREPLLSEARGNLAAALLCRGRLAEAAQEYSRSQRRNPAVTDIPAARRRALQGGAPTGSSLADVDTVLDLSKGVDGELPSVRLPINPDGGAASAGVFEQASEDRQNASRTALDRSNELSSQLATQLVSSSVRNARTYLTIGFYTEWQRQRPELNALYDRLRAEAAEMGGVYDRFFIQRLPQLFQECQRPTSAEEDACKRQRCPAEMGTAHTEWLGHARAAEAAMREWVRGLHNYATAVAANLENPTAYGVILALAEWQIHGAYDAFFLDVIDTWTRAERDVLEDCANAGGEAAAEEGDAAFPGGIPCPPDLKAIKVKFDLGFLSIDYNCEAVSAEVAFPQQINPFFKAGPFAAISYTYNTGHTTIFAGAKGGVSAGTVNAGIKSGAYVTFDGASNLVDGGVRLTGGVAVGGSSPLSFNRGAKVEVSFAGAFL